VTRLTVFYDARCGLCCAVRDWIARQPQIVPVACVPKEDGMEDLVVVADSGEVWSGDGAWVVVLWALADYRHWAGRLASPVLLPAVRSVFARLSKYRGALSCRLGLPADADRPHDAAPIDAP
jgi:predicted DCC family thiol-disulfide oxidoreductase YuxK